MRWKRSLATAGALGAAATLITGLTVAVPGAQAAPNPAEPWDFDGDHNPELVVPATRAVVNNEPRAGALGVFYGTDDGPTKQRWQRVDRQADWFPGTPSEDENFGERTASGDFDGDGYADLAFCGTDLVVAFGGPEGLSRAIEVPEPESCGDVAVTDADGDGYADLVLFGYDLWLASGSPDAGTPEGWRFEEIAAGANEDTYDLVVGDVTGNGYPDIVFTEDATSATVFAQLVLGGPDGYTRAGEWTDGDEFLGRLMPALADFDGDGHDDMVLGMPDATVGGEYQAGKVEVWLGSADGIDPDQEPLTISQSTPGVPGSSEAGDLFGATVAVTGGPQYPDLAIGVPGEHMGSVADAGRVVVAPGSPDGPDTKSTYQLHRNREEFPGAVRVNDMFGAGVAYYDRDQLVIAVPGQREGAGRAYVVDDITSDPVIRFRPEDAEIDPREAGFGT